MGPQPRELQLMGPQPIVHQPLVLQLEGLKYLNSHHRELILMGSTYGAPMYGFSV